MCDISSIMKRGDKPFRILSVDGGGFRGTYAAHLLRRIEEEWQLNWTDHFDLFAGTSTGAIIVAGLACGKSASELAAFYDEHGKHVFSPRLRSRLDPLKLFTSRYSIQKLKAHLDSMLGKVTLGEIPTPLILPSVDIGNGCVHVLKSRYSPNFVRDPRVRLSDAVLASCAAPTYFDPVTIDTYQLVDGGLWANNPSMVAVIDAQCRLGVELSDIRVLSIGTGKSKAFYPRSHGKWKDRLVNCLGWGLLTRWHSSRFIDLIFNLQSDNAHNMLCLLMNESTTDSDRVLRLTFESDRPLPMDCIRRGDDWISRADHTFTHESHRIAKFLALEGVKTNGF